MVKKAAKQKQREPDFFVKLEAAYSETEGLVPMRLDGIPFKVKGRIGAALHVEVAADITQQQADRLSKVLEEASGHAPLVVTNNIRLMRMRKLSFEQAKQLVTAGEQARRTPAEIVAAAEAELKAAQASPAEPHPRPIDDGSTP